MLEEDSGSAADALEAGSVCRGRAAAPDGPLTLEERLTALELGILSHPAHEAALDALEECVRRARMRRDGRRLKAKLRLIYGDAGTGKTTLLEAFLDRYPDEVTPDGDIRRVIPVEMPEQTTKRALVSAVLSALGYAAGARDSANDIIDDIVDKVQRLGVEMILIDEGHHVLTGKSVEAISEFLKSLLNRVGCIIAIAGLPELQELHNFEQLDRRLMPDVRLTPYSWRTIAGRLMFLALLGKFEQALGLPEASDLADEDFAMRIYTATNGVVGIVAKYLSRALELAEDRGLARIDKALMAEIYAAWHPAPQPAEEIGFTTELVVPDGETPDTLLAKLLAVPIDEDTNPFLCSAEACEKMWEAAKTKRDEAVKSKQRRLGTGRRKTRASGPAAIKAFK